MKEFYKYIIPILLYFVIVPIHGQGVIINEMSNGTSGSQEFVELLVVGSATDPTGNVDLSGWILDDNNGDFEASSTGVGIAGGHIRIAAGCLTSVSPGTLIVLYNAPDLSFPDDATDANEDCVYFLSDNSPCLEDCTSSPSSSNASYNLGCIYGPANWSTVSLRNGGDAIQIRNPSAEFFHGFSYGDVTVPAAPSFPVGFGGGTAFAIAGSGTASEFIYNDGDFTDGTNFSRQTAANATPGLPNNNNNQYVINQMRAGTFDYTNLSTSGNTGTASSLDNCPILLPLRLGQFTVEKIAKEVLLSWMVKLEHEPSFLFEVERSLDGIHFEYLGEIEGRNGRNYYDFIDTEPWIQTYYRLKIILGNGSIIYSPVRVVSFSSNNHNHVTIAPNPIGDVLTIRLEKPFKIEMYLKIYNLLGEVLVEQKIAKGEHRIYVNVANLTQGSYILSLKNEAQAFSKVIIK